MTHRLCFISRNYRGIDSSGNKAKTDNETTLRQMGAHNLGLRTTYYNSKILTFFLDLAGIIKMMLTIRPGDIVLLQYPVKKYFAFICKFAHLRHAKTIALIHDLGSMRRKKLNIGQEIKRLMHADYVIASNEKMQGWLAQHGFTNPTGALQLFDYRSERVALSVCPSGVRSLPKSGLCRRLGTTQEFLSTQDARTHQRLSVGNLWKRERTSRFTGRRQNSSARFHQSGRLHQRCEG